jgi:arsenate reductase
MKKIWHLSTCSTNKRILKELNDLPGFEKQDIKNLPLTPAELDMLAEKAGSYEALFSRNSNKYKEWGLKDKILSEVDFRSYILKEYTMLKRPVILDGEVLFVGNDKNIIEKAKKHFGLQ